VDYSFFTAPFICGVLTIYHLLENRPLRGPITARRPADAEVLCVRGAPGIEVFEVFDYEL